MKRGSANFPESSQQIASTEDTTEISYEEMRSLLDDNQRVAIVGTPGNGKTTFVKRLVDDWTTGKWDQPFETLFFLPLSEIERKDPQNSLIQTIVDVNFPTVDKG